MYGSGVVPIMANGAAPPAMGCGSPIPAVVVVGEKGSFGAGSDWDDGDACGSLETLEIAVAGVGPNLASKWGMAARGTVALTGLFALDAARPLSGCDFGEDGGGGGAAGGDHTFSGMAVRARGSTSPPGRLGRGAASGTGAPHTEQNFFEPMSSALHFEHVIMRPRCSHAWQPVPTSCPHVPNDMNARQVDSG